MSTENEESLESKKLRLEIEALEAAAAHTADTREIEIKKAEAELDLKQLEVTTAQINLTKLTDEERERIARENHFVYRFTGVVDQKSVTQCIEKLDLWSDMHPAEPLEIVFTSPGGSVYAGMALFDHIQLLSRKGHHITTGAEGYAASMAGILLQAGDLRWQGQESYALIHEVRTMDWGTTSALADTVEHLKRMEKRVIRIFLDRAEDALPGGSPDLLTEEEFEAKWKKTDWWLTSDEMLKHGFIDEVR